MSLTSDFLNGSIVGGFDAKAMRAALEELDRQQIDPLTKGLPAAHETLPLADIAKQNWNLLAGDPPAPVLVMRQSSLAHNARWTPHPRYTSRLQPASHHNTTTSPHP